MNLFIRSSNFPGQEAESKHGTRPGCSLREDFYPNKAGSPGIEDTALLAMVRSQSEMCAGTYASLVYTPGR